MFKQYAKKTNLRLTSSHAILEKSKKRQEEFYAVLSLQLFITVLVIIRPTNIFYTINQAAMSPAKYKIFVTIILVYLTTDRVNAGGNYFDLRYILYCLYMKIAPYLFY